MTLQESDSIFTVVSRPGPVERTILEGLLPRVESHRRVGGGVSLRTLEGGDGPTVVFLHGRGHAASMWAPILTRMAMRFRVVAVDLPGFGHSGAPPFDGSHPEEGLSYFVDPVEDFVASLSAESGVVLVGHSLGGLVALRMALQKRVRVRGLALICAMGLAPTMSTKSRIYLRSNPERIARIRAGFSLGARANSDLDKLRIELLTSRGGRRRASAAFDAMVPIWGPAFNLRDRLSDLALPTLLLWGAHDEAFPVSIAHDAHARIRGSELSILDAPHSPHVSDPSSTLQVLTSWIDRLKSEVDRSAHAG